MPQGGRYPHIIRAVLGQPWAIDPDSLAWAAILDVLSLRASGQILTESEIAARIDAAANGPRIGGQRQDKVAILPLYGVISPRANLMSQTSGGTSAEEFGAMFAAAVSDPEITAIVLDVDSPGGSVTGIHEVATQIRAARGTKPIAAVANHMAASAAYWIASQADELVSTPSGEVGSIGIIGAHDDVSAALEAEGIKRTIVTAGKYKGEGAFGSALSAEATADLQGRADTFYETFTSDVAKGRNLSTKAVRAGYGEGRTILARQALSLGMIDRIDSLDNTIRRMASGRGRVTPSGPRAYAAVVVGEAVGNVEPLEQDSPAPPPIEAPAPPAPSRLIAPTPAEWVALEAGVRGYALPATNQQET